MIVNWLKIFTSKTSLISKNTHKKSWNPSVTETYSVGSYHDAKLLYRKTKSKDQATLGILYVNVSSNLVGWENFNFNWQNSRTRLLNYLKWLNQFAASICNTYAKISTITQLCLNIFCRFNIENYLWHARAYSRKTMSIPCLILGFVTVCLCTKLSLTVKAVKSSINVSNVSCKNCTLLWYAKKSIYMKYLRLLSQKTFFPDFPIWAPKLDVPNNWYTAVQTELMYPLDVQVSLATPIWVDLLK